MAMNQNLWSQRTSSPPLARGITALKRGAIKPAAGLRRTAWWGGILGLMLALVLFAPASWLASGISKATAQRVVLQNPQGSLWRGLAVLQLQGGEGSQDATALPGHIHWQLAPTWAHQRPAMRLILTADCCTTSPLALLLLPTRAGMAVHVSDHQSNWPAGLLVGLGAPLNTLALQGRLQLQTQGLQVQLRIWSSQSTATQMMGQLIFMLHDAQSNLSTLRPLGHYEVRLSSSPPTSTPQQGDAASNGQGESAAPLNLQLSSLPTSALILQGQGQLTNGQLRFEGEAKAQPDKQSELDNLLNIIGRREGDRSILRL